MNEKKIVIYHGQGRGKTSAALGNAIFAAERGENVIIIQFMKSKSRDEYSIIKRMEPEIKLFRFEKSDREFELLSPAEQDEEKQNIRNGLNYAKKVLATGESNMLILDEVLALLELNIVGVEELVEIFDAATEPVQIVLTGRNLNPQIANYADEIYDIEPQ